MSLGKLGPVICTVVSPSCQVLVLDVRSRNCVTSDSSVRTGLYRDLHVHVTKLHDCIIETFEATLDLTLRYRR